MKKQSEKPDYLLEREFGAPERIICGVDEVGRGPLAGPVIAAAVVLNPANIPCHLNDSKKLSAKKREELNDIILATAQFGFGEATLEEIDALNILHASMLAMQRAVTNLPCKVDHILVDGNRLPNFEAPATAVIKGDQKSLSIAAASIIAKIKRDFLMKKLAKIHPEYGWDRNAGYGTREHMEALNLVGPSRFHRKSFAPIRDLMTQQNDITD
ncbi:MAG: ribonuclease HII [Alphaproteobacteria bacterium]|nr:ribonuclease HII [Alphaproteobacteria bacterium]HPF46869.1 ribonuclease HII [Emcibacteraceae bacterium]HRW29175.1 ribonuclease HII [Emcibacteraceae bacterium]